jgi:hypothetical protein
MSSSKAIRQIYFVTSSSSSRPAAKLRLPVQNIRDVGQFVLTEDTSWLSTNVLFLVFQENGFDSVRSYGSETDRAD